MEKNKNCKIICAVIENLIREKFQGNLRSIVLSQHQLCWGVSFKQPVNKL